MPRTKGSKNNLKLSEKEIKEIIRLYVEDRVSLKKLQTLYHTTKIKDILVSNNIGIRTFRDSKRLYPFDESFFKNIDTPESAYFLGLFYADGCVRQGNNGQFLVKLALTDYDLVVLFREYIKSNKPILVSNQSKNSYGTKPMYILEYSSMQMYNDLYNWGCVPNKTFILKFPDLPKNLVSHFIRGYFDGDGSVFTHTCNVKRNLVNGKAPNYQLGCEFCGTENFLKEVLKYLELPKSVLSKDARKISDCWRLSVLSNKRSIYLYNFLYRDCKDLYLKRKKDKFDNFISSLKEGSTTIITNPTVED